MRRVILRPDRVVARYVQPGDTVLDIGCGTGFLACAAAERTGEAGLVIAVDIQEEMLALAREKARACDFYSRMQFHQSRPERLDLSPSQQVDTAFAWYVLHEVPDAKNIIKEVFFLLVPKGRFLVVEPGFVVSQKEFAETIQIAGKTGFSVSAYPRVSLSRAVLFKKE